MTTPRRSAKSTTAKRTASKRTTTRRSTSTRTTSRRTSSTTRARTTTRRRTGTATTIGAGVGTLVVSALLGATWTVRIALVVLVVVLGLAYLLWTHRAEIRSAATDSAPIAQSGSPTTDDSAGAS